MAEFKKLFEPGYIGKLRIKNRVVRAPFNTFFAARDGSVTPRLLNHFKEYAKGGSGLIIVEYAYIDQIASQAGLSQLGIYDDSFIPGLSTLARVIKDNGAKACMQFAHCGRQRFIAKYPMTAPSRVPWELLGDIVPTELTIEEIKEIIKAFGNAARISEQAGFDMVEIHGAHGYLITQFLSPYTNTRGDMYGGSLQNRMRFPLEVADIVRRSVSPGFPVSMRFSGTDYMDKLGKPAITIEESKVFARELEKAGMDVLHVSGGIHEAFSYEAVPMHRPLCFQLHLAEAIKKEVQIPVIASGSITNPQLAEDILKKGQADFISLGRPMVADPWFANKAKEGRPEDIIPCIRCNEGCLVRGVFALRPISCSVNATVGFEGELDIEPAVKVKKVAVVGGGPGGMEAARVAALRGHEVTLYEARDRLGGYLIEASVPEFKKDLISLIDYLSTQVKKLGVKVVLGKEATVQMIKQQGFDAVILATGSTPLIPDIRGIDKKSVMTAIDVLRGKQVGQNVVVAGGSFIGCEIALFLAEAGKKVRIFRVREKDAPWGIEGAEIQFIFEGFFKYGVELHQGLRLEEVIDGGAIFVDRYGKRSNFETDSVVLSLGFVARNDLLKGLEKANIEVYPVGDCVAPRMIYDAIHEGFFTSYRL